MKKMKKLISLFFVFIIGSFIFAQNGLYNTYIEKTEAKFVNIPTAGIEMLSTEVTQQLYELVMEKNPSNLKKKNYPVENVSWFDALCFCNKLSVLEGLTPVYYVNGSTDVNEWKYKPHRGDKMTAEIKQDMNANGYRLPLEEEWEFAAKGGEDFKYSGSDDINDVGWYKANSDGATHAVAKKRPNAYGLYDMTGNVSEWCWEGVDTRHYCRGGSFDLNAVFCENTNRVYYYGGNQRKNMGFRIVRKTSEQRTLNKQASSSGMIEISSDPVEAAPSNSNSVIVTSPDSVVVVSNGSVVVVPADSNTNVQKVQTVQNTKTAEQKSSSRQASTSQFMSSMGAKFVTIPNKNIQMMTTEVTQKLYVAVMDKNPSSLKKEKSKENYPVENVSWYDAICFCNLLSRMEGLTPVYYINGSTDVNEWGYTPHRGDKIEADVKQDLNANGYRLPNEDEWEYAAKGGESFKYAGSDDLNAVGWYKLNSDNTIHPVAKKKPNGFGLYDMTGNVSEWCWEGVDLRHYCRGGSFDVYANYCENEFRVYYYGGNQRKNMGFRIVRPLR